MGGSTRPACPTQAPPCLGQEGIPKPPQSADFPKVAPEPLLFIRTPPPMHTQQSGGRDNLVPSCPPATSGCHVGAQPAWASVPSSGEWANSHARVGSGWRERGTVHGGLPTVRGAQERSKNLSNRLSEPRAPPYKGKATGVKFRDGQVKPGAHNRCLMSASGHWPRPDPRAPRGGCHPGGCLPGQGGAKGSGQHEAQLCFLASGSKVWPKCLG